MGTPSAQSFLSSEAQPSHTHPQPNLHPVTIQLGLLEEGIDSAASPHCSTRWFRFENQAVGLLPATLGAEHSSRARSRLGSLHIWRTVVGEMSWEEAICFHL